MAFVLAGLLAGILHALTAPDHVAALAPLAAVSRARAWRLALAWGAGHAGSVALVGGLAFMLRSPLLGLERLPGGQLLPVAMGLWALWRVFDHRPEEHAHGVGLLGFGVGLVSSLAGSAQLLGIMPVLAIGSRAMAIAYMGAFVAGTLLAVLAVCLGLGQLAGRLDARWSRGLAGACALGAMAAGVWLPA